MEPAEEIQEDEIEEEGKGEETEANIGEATPETDSKTALESPEDKPAAPVLPVQPMVPREGIIEAALFIANKPMNFAELALLAKCTTKEAEKVCRELQKNYSGGVEIMIEGRDAKMQVKAEFLQSVSSLSREIELSRKATKILALIAKKGQVMQSELKNYFRGEIYAYVTELKEKKYLVAEKRGNTRLLKPTKKFQESFQVG
jgi:chromosome segregation and condensation protein ScpB